MREYNNRNIKIKEVWYEKWTVSLLLCLFSLLLVACGGKGAAEGEKKDSLVYAQISEGKLWIHKIPRNNILKDR